MLNVERYSQIENLLQEAMRLLAEVKPDQPKKKKKVLVNESQIRATIRTNMQKGYTIKQ